MCSRLMTHESHVCVTRPINRERAEKRTFNDLEPNDRMVCVIRRIYGMNIDTDRPWTVDRRFRKR